MKDWTLTAIRLGIILAFIFLVLVIFCPSCLAQTRLYLPSTGAAAVNPSFSAGWEDTGGADRIALATAAGGSTAQTGKTVTDANNTIDTDLLARQYVSPPLNGAQTISGTIKGQVKASESANPQNAFPQMTVYVVSNDGLTVRGTAMAMHSSALSSEFSTSNVNRKFPLAALSPVTLSSVSASDCDRIVIEYGSRNNSTGTGATITLVFGDDSASDLAENETQSTTADPWVEFSATISFRAEAACGGGARRRGKVIG